MRFAARVLALCYVALVTGGPLAHAAERAAAPSAGIEAQHGAACAIGHDPATCPIAGLSRSAAPAERAPHVAEPRVLRRQAGTTSQPIQTLLFHGPQRATGPPLPVMD